MAEAQTPPAPPAAVPPIMSSAEPMPSLPPPPPSPALAARRNPSRRGCLLAFLICLGLFGIGLVAGSIFLMKLMMDSTGYSGTVKSIRTHEELLLGESGATEKIVVIDIKGIILAESYYDGASSQVICETLDAVLADPSVRAVLLDMNTPGGEVCASDEIHHALQKVREHGIPVVTCMRSLAASGGYFIAAGTDYIIANRLTLTGSVGVIIPSLNYAGLFDKIGVKSESYKSGAMKDMLSGGRTPTPAEVEYVNLLVQNTFQEFLAIVAAGRPGFNKDPAQVRAAPFADGRILSGREALAYGLVDGLGYFEDAVAKARSLGRAPGAKVVRLKRSFNLAEFLFSVKGSLPLRVGPPLPEEWSRIRPGQPYYLLPSACPY